MLRSLFEEGWKWMRRLMGLSSTTASPIAPPEGPTAKEPPAPQASAALGEPNRDDGDDTEGQDRKGDSEPRLPQRRGRRPRGQSHDLPETLDEDDTQPPTPAASEDGESTPADEIETDGHDRKNGGKGQLAQREGKTVKEQEPPPPRRIRGRRNGAMRSAPVERASFKPRPELVCRRRPGSVRWEIVAAADVRIAAVNLDGQPLSLGNGRWALTSFTGRLSIDLKDGPPIHVSLFDKDPLIFKLSKDWTGDGRRVPRVTKGHFIVIAPLEWVRSGHVPVEPDGCSDPAFRAHYFFWEGNESPGDLGGFEGRGIPSNAPGFELRGTRVFDDSGEGDLFVATPPRLTPAERVVWARVGEESMHGWEGRNFRPSEIGLAEVLNGRQGRFFLRVYDELGAMLDGDQFRYLRGLREIRVNGEPYSENTLLVPPATGHPPTTVRFIGVDGLRVRSTLRPGAAPVEDGKDGLIVEARPDADEVSCELMADRGCVDLALRLPRIWWRMERDGDESDNEYRSTPFEMTREMFRKKASAGALVRLRIPILLRSVRVGFDTEFDRAYQVTECEAGYEIELPLEHFEDYTQMERRFEDSSLNIRCANESWSLVQLLADPDISFSPRLATGKPTPPEACLREIPEIGEFRSTLDASCSPPWCWHPTIIDQVVQRLRALPGITGAAAYYEFPVQLRYDGPWLEGRCRGASTDWAEFSPGNFVAGESFAPPDVHDARAVVVLSSLLAEDWFGKPVAALGRHLNARVKRGAASERFEIVGVFEPQDDISDRASSCFIVAPGPAAAKRLKDRTRRITMEMCGSNENRSAGEMEEQVNAALHDARYFCRRKEQILDAVDRLGATAKRRNAARRLPTDV